MVKSMVKSIENNYLKISQAAELLSVNASTVLRWIEKGYIKSVQYPSGSHRIPRSEINRLLEQSRKFKHKKIYNVMIIDDEEFLLDALKEVLETSGLPLAIHTNRDGLDAMIEIGTVKPDLIVIDYKLGEVDGLTISQKIQHNAGFEKIPIIMISGYAEEAINSGESGISVFLKKPFKSADLKRAIVKCLHLDVEKAIAPALA